MILPDFIERFEKLSNEKVLVLTAQWKGKTDKRNIFLIDSSGNIVWQIEKAPTVPDPHYVLNFPYNGWKIAPDGKLICCTQAGYDFEIDWNTGKILRLEEYHRW